MANVKNYLDTILKEKKNWDAANQAGNQTAMDTAASKANAAYDWLNRNGYDGVASQLSKSNYTQAQKVADKFINTSGKTEFRPYMEAMAKDNGISKEDINKDIGYNSLTGEVSLGGKNLGRPAAEYDGVSYWDEADLKKAFDNYIATKPRTEQQLMMDNANYATKGNIDVGEQIKTDKADMQKRYGELSDYAMADPYDTAEGRAIMSRYNLAGLNARDNAIALGGASNGGNVDSSSAANAMRQQMALVGQGQQAVESMYGTRIDKVNQILQGLGAYNMASYDAQGASHDRAMTYANSLFNNGETRKMNDDAIKTNEVARQAAIADITGYAAPYMTAPDLFNSDGTLKNPEMDYTSIMNELQRELDALPDDGTKTAEREKIKRRMNDVQKAINAKVTDPSGKWSEWANLYRPTDNQRTETGYEFDQSMKFNAAQNADTLMKSGGRGIYGNNGVNASSVMNLFGDGPAGGAGGTITTGGVSVSSGEANPYTSEGIARIYANLEGGNKQNGYTTTGNGASSSGNGSAKSDSSSKSKTSGTTNSNGGSTTTSTEGQRVYNIGTRATGSTELYGGDSKSKDIVNATRNYVNQNLSGYATEAEIREYAGSYANQIGANSVQVNAALDAMLR